jgi:pimeloyl-ACP methyl ester carboxylesterase
VRGLIAEGRPGPAVASFLTEVVGLTPAQVLALRDAPPGPDDVLAIATRTLVREGEALAALDLAALARPVRQPVLLLHGTASPAWVAEVVAVLARELPRAQAAVLVGEGHEAVDTAAPAIAERLTRFLDAR